MVVSDLVLISGQEEFSCTSVSRCQ